jgi:hypothetical protein
MCSNVPEEDPGADSCPGGFPVCCACVSPPDFSVEGRCYIRDAGAPTTTGGIPCYSLNDCTERAPGGLVSTCTVDGGACPSTMPFCCARQIWDTTRFKRACSDHELIGWQCVLDAGSCSCPPPRDAGIGDGGAGGDAGL